MAISDTARSNHDELFPNYQSTLAAADPELIGIFDNFAFDEVLAHTTLEPTHPNGGDARSDHRQ